MLEKILKATVPIRYKADGYLYKRIGLNSQLEALRNICTGRAVLVVGNGPSLNETPLNAFCDVFSIGMNKINLLFPRVEWRPSLILSINNLVVRQNRRFWAESDIPVFLSWKSRWLLPRNARNSVKYFLQNPEETFATDITKGLGSCGTVTYSALQFAYFMGANPVILFGVDHAFTFVGQPSQLVRSAGADPNHFDPNYFAPGMYWGLPDLTGSESGYKLAKQAFERDGREVLDATIGGKLTVFPKISVSNALELCVPHARS